MFPDPGPSMGPGGRKVNRGRLSISNFQMKPGKSTDIQKSCNLPKLHQAWSEREILCFPELREPAAHWEPRVKRLLPSHPSSNAGPAAPAPPAGPSPRFRGGKCEEAFTQGLPGLSLSHWGHQACRPSHAQACSGLSSGGSDGTESSTSAPGTAYRNQG